MNLVQDGEAKGVAAVWDDSLEISTHGHPPVLVMRRVFQASACYPWPDLPDHWFVKLIATKRWHLVRFNVVTDRLRIDLSREWSFSCSLGYEAWIRWNIRAERQLVQRVEPNYQSLHEKRLEAFKQILAELYEAKELLEWDT